MKQYMTVFRKETEDRTRFWVSVSTETVDKKGRRTGEYINANIPAYMSNEAYEASEGLWKPTKNDEIDRIHVQVTDAWLKAVEGRDENFVALFINHIDIETEDEKPASKGGRK